MDKKISYEEVERPNILLIAEPEGLAFNFVEALLANITCVTVVSENLQEWYLSTKHLKDNIYFQI